MNKEQVLYWLEKCSESQDDTCCSACPYRSLLCSDQLLRDAAKIIRSQCDECENIYRDANVKAVEAVTKSTEVIMQLMQRVQELQDELYNTK